MSRAGLTVVSVRRAVHPEWVADKGYGVGIGCLWAALRLPGSSGKIEREFSFIHRPTGLACPGLYAKTLAGARPVLEALEAVNVGATLRAGKRPGDTIPAGAGRRLRSRIVKALRDADLSGLLAVPLQFTFGLPKLGADTA